MGGKGAKFENGKYKEQLWKQDTDYGPICGIKVLKKTVGNGVSLPFCSVKPGTKYIALRKDGSFFMLRVYDMNRFPLYDVEYGCHGSNVRTLHVHFFPNNERDKNPTLLNPGDEIYERHKDVLKKFGL